MPFGFLIVRNITFTGTGNRTRQYRTALTVAQTIFQSNFILACIFYCHNKSVLATERLSSLLAHICTAMSISVGTASRSSQNQSQRSEDFYCLHQMNPYI